MDSQYRSCSASSVSFNRGSIIVERFGKAEDYVNGIVCRQPYALKIEVKPFLPIACLSHVVQKPVILFPMLLEVQAQIKRWVL